MASETWYGQIESNLFNKFKNLMTAHSNTTVSGANYTSVGVSTADIELPTVYLHELSGIERGEYLSGTTVNALLYNVEIIVYAGDKSTCALLSRVAIAQMKTMSFGVTATPTYTYVDSDIVQSNIRFRRAIGVSDVSSGLIT